MLARQRSVGYFSQGKENQMSYFTNFNLYTIVIYDGVFNIQSIQPGTKMMCINLLFFDLSYFFLLKKSLLKNVVFLIAFSGFYNAIEVSALAFLQTDVFKMAG